MKITRTKVIKLTIPAFAVFLLFACSKDTDLLADYVIADSEEAYFLSGLVLDDYFVSSTDAPMVLDVLSNDGFIDSEKVTIVEITPPSNGSVTINEDKTITYTPGASPEESTLENPEAEEEKEEEEEEPQSEVEAPPIETPKSEEQPAQPTDQGQSEPEEKSESKEEMEEEIENPSPELTDNEIIIPAEEEPENGTSEPNTPELDPETESKEETEDSFDYTVEIEGDDDTVNTQTGTVNITTNRDYGVLKAFPTAYGAGSKSSGGRGGEVYVVTNLNNSGSGSFRDAVSQSNRYIVFDVSGTIELKGNLKTSSDNLTIAGQTAPEGGITLTGDLLLMDRCDNIIMRYIRFKPKYIPEYISAGNNKNTGYDALNLSNITNSIFDHVSIAWGGDEAVSIVGDSNNVTFQNCLVIDSHKGMILGDSDSNIASNMSLLNNVFVNAGYRFPNVCATNAESINNVVHNWQRNLNVFPCRQGAAKFNEINNYYQRGQKTNKVLSASRHGGHWLDLRHKTDARAYTKGNIIDGVQGIGDDNWKMYRMRFGVNSGRYAGLKQWDPAPLDFRASSPFNLLGDAIPIKTANEALQEGFERSGCSIRLNGDGSIAANYDELDEKFLGYVKTNTYIAHEKADDVVKKQYYIDYHNKVTSSPISRRSGNFDSDGDGMPDIWEINVGHNPNKKDHNNDDNKNGYTNLEEYLDLADL